MVKVPRVKGEGRTQMNPIASQNAQGSQEPVDVDREDFAMREGPVQVLGDEEEALLTPGHKAKRQNAQQQASALT